jgi:hypothetical protein
MVEGNWKVPGKGKTFASSVSSPLITRIEYAITLQE